MKCDFAVYLSIKCKILYFSIFCNQKEEKFKWKHTILTEYIQEVKI